ncbi:MAG: extracellular solute-binding protein [Phycisphaerales bacterium]
MKTMAFSMIACVSLLAGCGGSASDQQNHSDNADTSTQQRVTLYTSVDDEFAKMVVAQFEQDTGIRVDLLGDTEATKTTGLVTRLQSEKDDPTCDVWWSSEPMGTILLAQGGVLEPGGMRGSVSDDWPSAFRADDWTWVGTALRRRVIVYAPDRVDSPPTSMHELIDPTFKGRVGMARPQFGTTRIHMSLLAAKWGVDGLEDWLGQLEANDVRLYDGNATVVRAVAMGEIDIAMTDTDDVWSGQRNGWDVQFTTEPAYDPGAISGDTRYVLPADQIMIPNTVAVVKDAPNPELAKRLAAYLSSPAVERLLYESTSGNHPVDAPLRAELGLAPLGTGEGSDGLPSYADASRLVEQAMDACERVLTP